MAIETAKDLYVANGADLRHWHDVSSDIIKYLKDKLNRAAEAVVYKGVLPNLNAFNALEDTKKGDVWTNEETGVNLMWNGEHWIPVSLFRMDFDKEAIENSINGIQSGYIWKALENTIDDPAIYRIVEEAEQDPELQGSLASVSNQMADLMQDVAEMRERYERIPNPLISMDELNEISLGDDGGAYFDSEHCKLSQKIESLTFDSEQAKNADVIVSSNGVVEVNESSSELIYIEADQDVQISFESLPKSKWMKKYIFIEFLNDVQISLINASFANSMESPSQGAEGNEILFKCIWVGGKVILEMIDGNS